MKIFKGKVISTKMAKTAIVTVPKVVIHPTYGKRIERLVRYAVHDELGVKVGDVVKFSDSKPYSKNKKWRITEVVGQKKGKV